MTAPRTWIVGAALVVLLFIGAYGVAWLIDDSGAISQARFSTIDELAGTYGGVGLGDSPAEIVAVHGPNRPVGEYETSRPKDAVAADAEGNYPNFMRAIGEYCYDDACFTFYDPRSALVPPNHKRLPATTRVDSIDIASPGAKTLRGIQVGDSVEEVKAAYPDANCGTGSYSEGAEFRYCRDKVAQDRYIWFGGDPVSVIIISAVFLG